jgi:hypothetical protein
VIPFRKLKPDSLSLRFLAVALSVAMLIGIGYLVRWHPHAVNPTPVVNPTPSVAVSNSASTSGSGAPASAPVLPPTAPAVVDTSNQVKSYDGHGALLATFTIGARTVMMNGPSRTFAEPSSTNATVTSTAWIRLYPTNFSGTVDKVWLNQMVAQNKTNASPDILGTAMQYIGGAQIDHMGIYFGVDSEGHRRLLSSRKVANGPTFGDIDGKAVLDGNAYFALRFRAVRRF